MKEQRKSGWTKTFEIGTKIGGEGRGGKNLRRECRLQGKVAAKCDLKKSITGNHDMFPVNGPSKLKFHAAIACAATFKFLEVANQRNQLS